jgi:aminopeptidase-like protein
MSATIKLKKYEAVNAEIRDRHVWVMKVTAIGTGIPSEVFVYINGPTRYQNYNQDTFQCVASTLQLEELPVGLTFTDRIGDVQFYRRSDAEFVFESPEALEEAWEIIKKDIKILLDNYNASQNLTEVAEVEIS